MPNTFVGQLSSCCPAVSLASCLAPGRCTTPAVLCPCRPDQLRRSPPAKTPPSPPPPPPTRQGGGRGQTLASSHLHTYARGPWILHRHACGLCCHDPGRLAVRARRASARRASGAGPSRSLAGRAGPMAGRHCSDAFCSDAFYSDTFYSDAWSPPSVPLPTHRQRASSSLLDCSWHCLPICGSRAARRSRGIEPVPPASCLLPPVSCLLSPAPASGFLPAEPPPFPPPFQKNKIK